MMSPVFNRIARHFPGLDGTDLAIRLGVRMLCAPALAVVLYAGTRDLTIAVMAGSCMVPGVILSLIVRNAIAPKMGRTLAWAMGWGLMAALIVLVMSKQWDAELFGAAWTGAFVVLLLIEMRFRIQYGGSLAEPGI